MFRPQSFGKRNSDAAQRVREKALGLIRNWGESFADLNVGTRASSFHNFFHLTGIIASNALVPQQDVYGEFVEVYLRLQRKGKWLERDRGGGFSILLTSFLFLFHRRRLS